MKFTSFALATTFGITFFSSLHAQSALAPSGSIKPKETVEKIDYSQFLLRVNATQQKWSMSQPWDKRRPYSRSALGVVIGPDRILTTAEMGSNIVSIELEDARGIETVPAKVVAVDYGANLAILETDLPEGESSFVSQLKPVQISEPLNIGDSLTLAQIEDNGMTLLSQGQLQTVDILSTFAPGEHLLCYIAKVSLQSASSSFSIPAFNGDQLLGLLSSYDSEDQTSTIISAETIRSFLADVEDGTYTGFPALGIGAFSLTDPNLRAYLELPDGTGGIYVSRVRKGSPADLAGLQKGDVITQAAGYHLDLRGYFTDERYGRMYWTHIISGKSAAGDKVPLKIRRDGEEFELTATLASRSSLRNPIPRHLTDRAPHFLVKGGLIFQELSRPFLRNFGKDWKDNAPLELLTLLANPDKIDEQKESVIILSAVIPTQATLGYERMRNTVVESVNGVTINCMADLDTALSQDVPTHSIMTTGTPDSIFLDAALSNQIDSQLLQRGLPQLKRVPKK